jgi:hypothetical protein
MLSRCSSSQYEEQMSSNSSIISSSSRLQHSNDISFLNAIGTLGEQMSMSLLDNVGFLISHFRSQRYFSVTLVLWQKARSEPVDVHGKIIF